MSFPNFDAAKAALRDDVSYDDFWAYMPMHNYIFAPTRTHWPGASVDARLPRVEITDAAGEEITIPPTKWLDTNKPVEQMTWAPGLPTIIEDRLLLDGGWVERRGVACFNLYMPPTLVPGDPQKADRWLAHVRLVYPDEADHILDYFAHRVQRPGEKINHALVLGGGQGIGKDRMLAPVREAIGPWNFQEISPSNGKPLSD